jgi:hypothetical protein
LDIARKDKHNSVGADYISAQEGEGMVL